MAGGAVGTQEVDVLIVGAGISGIGAAYHVKTMCPNRTFAVIEGRDQLGGTWDLFRYPGVRSDSDMHTLGYRFKPWTSRKAIADGPSILRYVEDTARDVGVDQHVRLHHRVTAASWSSEDALWTVHAERTDTGEPLDADLLASCSAARATTATTTATSPASRAATTSSEPSCIRSTGRRTSTSPDAASS